MAGIAATPLGPEDRAILALESATVAGHTCKVVRLGAGDEGVGAPSIDALRTRIADRLVDAPLLTCMLGSEGGVVAWVPDPAFDVARHVTEAPVDGPLDRGGVLTVVASLFAQHLPRDRPLWKMDAIHLPDGGALLVWRIHHALADGTATMRYARMLLWDGDDAAAPTRTSDTQTRASGPLATGAAAPHAAAAATAHRRARLAAEHAADERRRRGHLAAFLRREYARSHERSPFDGTIGTRREIGFAAISFAALHDAARTLDGATVNDGVLAVVTGALRQWLVARHGTLGDLRVRVPVSLHHEGDDAANRDSFFSLALPLGLSDPVERLRAIHAQTSVRKADHDAERRELLLHEMGHVSPQLADLATRLERSPRRFALSVSNVVGPRAPVELLSAPVQALHGLAEIGERHALRIAVTSFADRLCFGLLADPLLVPDVQTMAAAIEVEAELLRAATA
ncbi:wax ester/triacylglycerol synthase domain-containing protein [Conexibacter sp. CPCC 206217]|uniref:wax ester/triacylglycerol synthase domain-containing protein n=1 Tax=Conexibacter sp. CPCC 206217 TaxID=3064574 RepID=UPI002726DCE5|nr:wax ester/triacylglycerol synthase domain-containing protein [Conexibacter sp. CPCC 206217]MDO8209037.1 wax ester/triacylglycerol synthase family O-acyltransferase [Conexibacter sp. CPCC 206217]